TRGRSCDRTSNPSGIIQKPSTGRKPNRPNTTRIPPRHMRSPRDCGSDRRRPKIRMLWRRVIRAPVSNIGDSGSAKPIADRGPEAACDTGPPCRSPADCQMGTILAYRKAEFEGLGPFAKDIAKKLRNLLCKREKSLL